MKDQLEDKVKISEKHRIAFREIESHLRNSDLTWALTGSLAFSLQGIPYKPNDIDIRTDREGAYLVQEILKEYLVEPVSKRSDSEVVSSHLGRFLVHSVEVEVMGDMQLRASDGSWDPPAKINDWIRWIRFEEQDIPVLSISFESDNYRRMGRLKKADILSSWSGAKEI